MWSDALRSSSVSWHLLACIWKQMCSIPADLSKTPAWRAESPSTIHLLDRDIKSWTFSSILSGKSSSNFNGCSFYCFDCLCVPSECLLLCTSCRCCMLQVLVTREQLAEIQPEKKHISEWKWLQSGRGPWERARQGSEGEWGKKPSCQICAQNVPNGSQVIQMFWDHLKACPCIGVCKWDNSDKPTCSLKISGFMVLGKRFFFVFLMCVSISVGLQCKMYLFLLTEKMSLRKLICTAASFKVCVH